MLRKLSIIALFFILLLPVTAKANNGEYVILLHGIAKTNADMSDVEDFMRNKGYNVINIDYPSRDSSIKDSAKYLAKVIKKNKKKIGNSKVHFITHSMGGIVVRKYLKTHRMQNLGRVVMLAPPNKGSQVADFYKDNWLFSMIFGPAGNELVTENNGFIKKLGNVNFELGVIAGNSTLNPLLSFFLLPGEDDGKVTIENTKIDGMKDHIIIDASHVLIHSNEEALRQAEYFIRNGRFDRSKIN